MEEEKFKLRVATLADTEELKAKDPMMWVGLMNNLKSQAEETILAELIHS